MDLSMLPVLLIDDEPDFLRSASIILYSAGIKDIVKCEDSRKVLSLLSKQNFSLIVMDMAMPYLSGQDLLPQIVQEYPEIPVIIITALDKTELAVNCMKKGAFDYIVKPIESTRLITTIHNALKHKEIQDENIVLREYLLTDTLKSPDAFSKIITNDKTMRSIFQYVEAVAQTSLPILITGETGVGKEVMANSIHLASQRTGRFIAVNVAGVDDTVFADTLFGHERGAFTGAEKSRKGLIENATNGTLFLDEIGDLSFESQIKLLRLLQEGTYFPLGSDVQKITNARIIIATNRNIQVLIKEKKFRKDLYYRLESHHIHIPSLRKRKQDIRLLTEYFFEEAAKELKKKKLKPQKELFTLFNMYHFPGNIRELRGMIYDAVARHHSGTLSLKTFKQKILDDNELEDSISDDNLLSSPHSGEGMVQFFEKLPTLKNINRILIDEALTRADGNKTLAAQMLGITRPALIYHIKKSE
jgi:DNA-binding NtrC family response regulator